MSDMSTVRIDSLFTWEKLTQNSSSLHIFASSRITFISVIYAKVFKMLFRYLLFVLNSVLLLMELF